MDDSESHQCRFFRRLADSGNGSGAIAKVFWSVMRVAPFMVEEFVPIVSEVAYEPYFVSKIRGQSCT
jgi:hypothetical protein